MPTILITGSKGQVGQELLDLQSDYPGYRFLGVDLPELDLTDADAVKAFFEQHAIDYCFSCAAYTAVDRAETDEGLAHAVNVDAARTLAKCCADSGAALIHLSTDYVYHNDLNRPLLEDDPTHPQGVYAKTKLEGDIAVLETHARAMILRTSWVYSAFGNNFVKTMLKYGREREKLRVVFDQVGTPTYARDIARAMLDIAVLIEGGKDDGVFGKVYHYSNEGVCSWYDFAVAIFNRQEVDCVVEPIETREYPTPAKRPFYSLLNKSRIKKAFGLSIPHWEASLRHCLGRLEG